MMTTRKRQSGMSLIEVLAGLAIVSVMVLGTASVMSNAHHLTKLNTNKEFATQKAISIIEELKSLVQSNQGNTIVDLDAYDDGTLNKTLLTTQGQQIGDTPQTLQPDDPISGNVLYAPPDTWTFERRINVQKIPGQGADVRLVNVKVYQNTPGGQILLAEVASVIRTIVDNMPPTQVYDVYCLAIENIPGWWVYMSNLVPTVRNAISDLQVRNPGLVFRSHWITSLAYGRDQLYRPYINKTAVDPVANIDSVYFYPGKMPPACISSSLCGDDEYYPHDFFRGHMNVEGTDTDGYDAKDNPNPYAVADQYNNAMRYDDEMALYTARKNAAAAQTPPVAEEMTWRLLMDDMYMNPQNYTNALIINLHGELMPFPPVRNYSDAAKSPGQTFSPDLRSVRAVTHPEQLRYTNSDAVNLRVYTYLSNPAVATANVAGSGGPTPIMPVPLTIRIRGVGGWVPSNPAGCAAAGTCSVMAIHGGVDNDGSGGIDKYDVAPVPAAAYPVAGQASQMAWSASVDASVTPNETVIKLYGSPLTSPIEDLDAGGAPSGRGLSPQDRLYGLEYIPSPVEDLTLGNVQFSTDLTSTSVRPKNTARWIIKIPAPAGGPFAAGTGAKITVETRIGDQETSGVVYPAVNDPNNLSRTYVWRGDNQYVFGTTTIPPKLPLTERYQVLGDPRHCPYADLKRPHITNPGVFPPAAIVGPPAVARGAYESSLGMGYNRYFDDFEDANRNRGASAELTGSKVEPFAIVGASGSKNNIFAVKIDGGVTISTTLALANGNMTAQNIVDKLNTNAVFAAVAAAEVVNGRIRITSKGRTGSSVQFDTSVGNNCSVVTGFSTAPYIMSSTAGWPGWVYAIAGVQYGINNNGNLADAGWDTGVAADGTRYGSLEIDVHRLFQMLRSSLIRSNAVWTTMTGFSYYYIGIGNEIGYDDANGFKNSVPVSTKPFTGSAGSQYENNITGNVRYIRENNGAGSWWAMPWIGEIYPDASYATWLANGNLPAGVGASKFIRTDRGNFPPFTGTVLTQSNRRTKEMGSTTFFWTGSDHSTFHHEYKDSDSASINLPPPATSGPGYDIANNYSLPVPDTINNARPFDINYDQTAYNPENFLQAGAYPNAYLTKVLTTYYTHSGAPAQGSALISLADPVTNGPAFIAVNGLSPTGVAGTTFIAKWSFLTLIQSFLNGGLYTDATATPAANHIRQVPRIVITNPNINTDLKQKTTVTIGWTTTWRRWDGLTYTIDPAYAPWFENLTMKYAILYSPSNGVKDPKNGNPTGWKYASDNSVATPGVKPDSAHWLSQVISSGTTNLTYDWSTPAATFPQGNYLIRVEGYREGYALHYSFHQYRAFFQR